MKKLQIKVIADEMLLSELDHLIGHISQEQLDDIIDRLYCTEMDKYQADELIRIGFRFFPQPEAPGIAQWFWRSPKTKRGNGTLFKSTNQAYNRAVKLGLIQHRDLT